MEKGNKEVCEFILRALDKSREIADLTYKAVEQKLTELNHPKE